MSRMTIKSVAAACGMDHSTVSRILNRDFADHRYSAETVKRVEKAAREMGYRPSHAARSLRMGKTFTFALVVPHIANPFFSELAASVEAHAARSGYRLLLTSSDHREDRQREQLLDLVARGIDGVIVAPTGVGGMAEAAAAGTTVVTVDRPAMAGCYPHAGLDDAEAGAVLGEYLLGRGYRRVAVAQMGRDDDYSFGSRFAGLCCGLGTTATIVHVFRRTDAILLQAEVRDQVARWLGETRDWPQAIVGLNNVCTMASFEAIRLAGAQRRIALTGIDDFPGASLLDPALTVVAQPIEQIAAAAVSLLIESRKLASPIGGVARLLAPTLVERDSLPHLQA